ncbi:MAG: hypothetical protein ABEH66_08205 [Halobacteriales archaeon]
MTDGTCYLCGESYTGRGMTRHLRSCKDDHAAAADGRTVHLKVSGAHRPEYWLHLGVDAGATLADVDDVLRAVWLECCGHLSAFEIDGVRYEKPLPDDGPAYYERRGMDVAVGEVLAADQEVTYEYDFGTTSALSVQVVDAGPYDTGPRPPGVESIGAYARNDPPEIPCDGCDAPAAEVCTHHRQYPDEDAWFCADCVADHGCEDYAYLPVVNSPRTGLCGFTGARLTDWTPA